MFERGTYYEGGWPKGRTRNPQSPDCQERLLQARKDGFSMREIARLIRCDSRAVQYYLAGRQPSKAIAKRIRRRFTLPV